MTRAEEAALKAYPTPPSYVSNSPFGPFIPPPEDPQYQREIFVQGYEQAEKDTIERAISWIKKNTCMGVYEQELMRKELEDEK